MRLWFSFCFSLVGVTALAQTLTVEKIMRDTTWIGNSPSSIIWAPDSKSVMFSWDPEGLDYDSFYVHQLGRQGPEKMEHLDAVRRIHAARAIYNRDRTQRVHVYAQDLYITDVKTGQGRRITKTEESEADPRFIMNDQWVSFTRGMNLFAWNIRDGSLRQLTNFQRNTERARAGQRGRDGGQAGQEEWLADQQLELFDVLADRKKKKDRQEEFMKRQKETDTLKLIDIGDRFVRGLDISPSGEHILYSLFEFVQGKSTIVPNYVTESGFTTDINGRRKVGSLNGKYSFYIFDRRSNQEFQVRMDNLPGIHDLPDYAGGDSSKAPGPRGVFVGKSSWNPSGTMAIVDIRSQDNKDRWLMKLDPSTRALTLVDRQRDEAWIGGPGISAFNPRMGWISDQEFYYQSEASGFSHVYIYNAGTEVKKALTSGEYEVQDLHLSSSRKFFYLLTNEEHPGKKNWYRMNIDGTGKLRITPMEGGHEVWMSPDEKWIAYRYSYMNRPWELYIQENKPGAVPKKVTNKAMSAEFSAYPWREPKLITITASDGARVHARLYEPENAKKNNAAVIFVHGAGYLQNAHYWWSSYFREYMFHNLLADKGYTVLDIDYRGSSGYGRNWRTGIYRHMGGKDLGDHIDAAKYLVSAHGIDPGRLGIYGGSYGGFMTLMAMFTAPDVFKAGAALRPVTDWAHYNHGYTSNILNEPFRDSLAYARSSPINFAAGLKNHLLICHGMVDVNVHFQDVVRLSQRLIELGKDNWELAVYPVEDHGFVEPSSWTDEYKRILKLFDSRLLGGKPASE